MSLDRQLLELVRCPDCRGTLTPDDEKSTLTCDSCGLVYPVRGGVPVLLVDEASRPTDGQ